MTIENKIAAIAQRKTVSQSPRRGDFQPSQKPGLIQENRFLANPSWPRSRKHLHSEKPQIPAIALLGFKFGQSDRAGSLVSPYAAKPLLVS